MKEGYRNIRETLESRRLSDIVHVVVPALELAFSRGLPTHKPGMSKCRYIGLLMVEIISIADNRLDDSTVMRITSLVLSTNEANRYKSRSCYAFLSQTLSPFRMPALSISTNKLFNKKS